MTTLSVDTVRQHMKSVKCACGRQSQRLQSKPLQLLLSREDMWRHRCTSEPLFVDTILAGFLWRTTKYTRFAPSSIFAADLGGPGLSSAHQHVLGLREYHWMMFFVECTPCVLTGTSHET